jgi:hypothetical protein
VKLRTTSIADADVAEAALWMDQQREGLGIAFLEAVEQTFAQILSGPLACPTLVLPNITFKAMLRSKIVGRFPYRAIFTLHADEVIVVGVLHAHRDFETILRSRVGSE